MALISALTDNFNDNLFDASKWINEGAASTQVVEQNNRIELFNSATNGASGRLATAATYDFTDGFCSFRYTPRATQNLNNPGVYLLLAPGSGNRVYLQHTSGGNLEVHQVVSGVDTVVGSAVAYNATDHAYLRLRHISASGVLRYEGAPAAGAPWTQIGGDIAASNFAITAMDVKWAHSTFATGGTIQFIGVDDVNILPAASAPATPTGLSLASTVYDTVAVTFDRVTASPAATSYDLQRRSYSFGVWATIATGIPDPGSGATVAYTDRDLWERRTFEYRVRATNGAGSSAWSSVVSVTTPAFTMPAVTIYASPSGTNGGGNATTDRTTGTSSATPLSIKRAIEVALPGDTIGCQDGVYLITSSNGYGTRPVISNRGTAGAAGAAPNWITIRAINPGAVTFRPNVGSVTAGAVLFDIYPAIASGDAYLRFMGIVFDGQDRIDAALIYKNLRHVRVFYCDFTGFGSAAIGSTYGAGNVGPPCDYLWVVKCRFHHTGYISGNASHVHINGYEATAGDTYTGLHNVLAYNVGSVATSNQLGAVTDGNSMIFETGHLNYVQARITPSLMVGNLMWHSSGRGLQALGVWGAMYFNNTLHQTGMENRVSDAQRTFSEKPALQNFNASGPNYANKFINNIASGYGSNTVIYDTDNAHAGADWKRNDWFNYNGGTGSVFMNALGTAGFTADTTRVRKIDPQHVNPDIIANGVVAGWDNGLSALVAANADRYRIGAGAPGRGRGIDPVLEVADERLRADLSVWTYTDYFGTPRDPTGGMDLGFATFTGSPVIRSTARVGGASRTSLTITRGAITNNDTGMVAVYWETNATPPTAPSGWVQVGTDLTSGFLRGRLYRKLASNEPATYTWTFNGSTYCEALWWAYIGAVAADPIDAVAGQTGASGQAVTAPAIATATTNTAILMVAMHGNSAATWTGVPEGYRRLDRSGDAVGDIALFVKEQGAAATVPAATATITQAGDVWAAWHVALRSTTVGAGLPNAPSGLTATKRSPSQVILRWADAASNETGYVVERRLGAGAWARVRYMIDQTPSFEDLVLPAGATYYHDGRCAPGATYSWRVRAINGVGESAASNEVTVTMDPFTASAVRDRILPIMYENDPALRADLIARVNATVAGTAAYVVMDIGISQGVATEADIVQRIADARAEGLRPVGYVATNRGTEIDDATVVTGGPAARTVAATKAYIDQWAALGVYDIFLDEGDRYHPNADPTPAVDNNAVSTTPSYYEQIFQYVTERTPGGGIPAPIVILNAAQYLPDDWPMSAADLVCVFEDTGAVWNNDGTGAGTYAGSSGSSWSTAYPKDRLAAIVHDGGTGAADVTFVRAAVPRMKSRGIGHIFLSYHVAGGAYFNGLPADPYWADVERRVADVPLAPTGVGASVQGPTQVTVSWTDASASPQELGFVVQRAVGAGAFVDYSPQLAPGTVGYVDTGVVGNTQYSYRVRSVGQWGVSEYANVATVTTPGGVPAAPTNAQATALSQTVVRVTWSDNASDETAYEVERGLGASPSGWTVLTTSLAANVVSYDDATATANTTYTYRVRARNASGASAYATSPAVATPPTPPAAPATLSATAVSPTRIDLAWADVATETGYRVERQGPGDPGFLEIGTTGAGVVAFQDATVAASSTYTYRVRAFNAGGDGPYSPNAAATTPAAVPAAPTNLRLNGAVTTGSVPLAWDDNAAGETGYRIQRRVLPSGTFADLSVTLAANATGHTDTTVAENTTYEYRVRATSGTGDSPYSNNLTVQTPLSPPVAPTGLQVASVSYNSVTLAWNDVAGNESGYAVERDGPADATFVPLTTLPAGATGYTDPTVSPSTTYQYRVRAINSAGVSAYAGPVSATTSVAPPTGLPATGVTAVRETNGTIIATLIYPPEVRWRLPQARAYSLAGVPVRPLYSVVELRYGYGEQRLMTQLLSLPFDREVDLYIPVLSNTANARRWSWVRGILQPPEGDIEEFTSRDFDSLVLRFVRAREVG